MSRRRQWLCVGGASAHSITFSGITSCYPAYWPDWNTRYTLNLGTLTAGTGVISYQGGTDPLYLRQVQIYVTLSSWTVTSIDAINRYMGFGGGTPWFFGFSGTSSSGAEIPSSIGACGAVLSGEYVHGSGGSALLRLRR